MVSWRVRIGNPRTHQVEAPDLSSGCRDYTTGCWPLSGTFFTTCSLLLRPALGIRAGILISSRSLSISWPSPSLSTTFNLNHDIPQTKPKQRIIRPLLASQVTDHDFVRGTTCGAPHRFQSGLVVHRQARPEPNQLPYQEDAADHDMDRHEARMADWLAAASGRTLRRIDAGWFLDRMGHWVESAWEWSCCPLSMRHM
jgi:hypothetical protein